MNESSGSTPGVRRATLVFIFVTVVLDMLALGIIIPVLPKLVLEFQHGDSAQAARTYGIFGTVFAGMQFLFAPVLGVLSDRFGRRTVILISCFGLGLDYVFMALAPSLTLLFVGRVISGVCAASFSAPSAYIADVAPPEKRAASFGMLSAAFGLGFIIGPAFGGLLGMIGPRWPFWVAAGLSIVNACYGLFVLPESLPKEHRSPFQWKRANPVGALHFLRGHRELLGIAAVLFIAYIAHEVLPSTYVLYTDHRYHWNERDVGLTLAFVGLLSAIVQGGLVGPIVSRLGEQRSLIVGLLFGTGSFAIYGLAPSGLVFLLGIPLGSIWGIANPAAQALMSRRVGPDEQGRLQGALGGVHGIAGMIGPLVFAGTYASSIGDSAIVDLPGAAFLLAAVMLAASGLLASYVMSKSPRETVAV